MNTYEVIIVGGGLAGLTTALDLGSRGKEVLVIEKNTYPNHKVCGEYVSNEVKPYLAELGFPIDEKKLPRIDSIHLTSSSGEAVETDLPLGGFGISRFAFDHNLYILAKKKGVHFLFEKVSNVAYIGDGFIVTTSSQEKLTAPVVLGAYGKRSNLDVALKRPFMSQSSPWLALKCHYENYDHPSNVVGLHNFRGGYGGLSRTETGAVNFCCLVKYESFKKEKNFDAFQTNIMSKNQTLAHFFSVAKPKFDKPISIAQVSFGKKKIIENHVLMCGDAGGLIHPLCGNGMAIAIHSAKLVSGLVCLFLEKANFTRDNMEKEYQSLYAKNFDRRLWMGRQLQYLMMDPTLFDWGMKTVLKNRVLLNQLIKSTHGKPF